MASEDIESVSCDQTDGCCETKIILGCDSCSCSSAGRSSCLTKKRRKSCDWGQQKTCEWGPKCTDWSKKCPDLCDREKDLSPQLEFKALATPEQQLVDEYVEEKTIPTQACLFLEFDQGFTCAEYKLFIKSGKRVTDVALFFGRAGRQGTLVVPLLCVPSGKNIDGLAARGFITNADIDPNQDFVINIASLYDAVRSLKIYYSIGCGQFPDGVVRGQIFPK